MKKNFRKKLMQIANRLFSRGFNRSSALSTAWKLIKCGTLERRIAGTTFNGRQNMLATLTRYRSDLLTVKLVGDAENPHDKNAVGIAVTAPDRSEYLVGYLPKAVAAVVAVVLDKGLKITADSIRIVGGWGIFENYGARIIVTM